MNTDLRQRVLDVFRLHIPRDAPAALLDFPNHNNCGDSAIWVGERIALQSIGVEIAAADDQSSYDPGRIQRRIGKKGVVLLHGGGNMGSLWPAEQRYRERVISDFSMSRIVQLPQTLFFEREDALRAGPVLRAHQSFTVLVRDETSLEVASDLGLRAFLCPDAAFAIGSIQRFRDPRVPIVWQARTDGEADSHDPPQGAADVEQLDWLIGNPFQRRSRIGAPFSVRIRRAAQLAHRFSVVRTASAPLRPWAFDQLAERRVRRGCDNLQFGNVVVTDRLHGHILSQLMGIHHVILDTRQRKIAPFLAAFTGRSPIVRIASSPAQALAIARELSSES